MQKREEGGGGGGMGGKVSLLAKLRNQKVGGLRSSNICVLRPRPGSEARHLEKKEPAIGILRRAFRNIGR